jgi:hypothetical protein
MLLVQIRRLVKQNWERMDKQKENCFAHQLALIIRLSSFRLFRVEEVGKDVASFTTFVSSLDAFHHCSDRFLCCLTPINITEHG